MTSLLFDPVRFRFVFELFQHSVHAEERLFPVRFLTEARALSDRRFRAASGIAGHVRLRYGVESRLAKM